MEHVTVTKEPPEIWRERYRRCPGISSADPSDMAPDEIQREVVQILFDEDFWKKLGATDRELLTIVIVKDKAHHFDFLKAYTTWKVMGLWDKEKELNAQIDIEFRDNKDECLGNWLMHLLYEYNKKVVKEEILYARTSPIEEGTLFP